MYELIIMLATGYLFCYFVGPIFSDILDAFME